MADKKSIEEIRRNEIIYATLRMISAEGINNVTMDDVARESGLSKGGIAHYFSSKYELFKESFREFFDRIFKISKEHMDSCDDPLDKLLSFKWLYDWNDPEISIGYPLLFDCTALAAHDEEYKKLYHDWVEDWIKLLTGPLLEGVQSEKFMINDIESAARTISSILNGIATRWYLDSERHSSEWAIESFQEAVTRYLIKDN